MLHFQCNNCGFKIKAPDKYAGRKGKCPKCHEIVEVPTSSQKPPDDPPRDTRECPHCGETISAIAKKCKHCNESLDGFSTTQTTADKSDVDTSELQQEHRRLQKQRQRYIYLGFILGVSVIVLMALFGRLVEGAVIGFIVGLILLACLRDYNKDRIMQIAAALRASDHVDVSQLQQEYSTLQKERRRYNRLSFIIGIPGFVLMSLSNIIFFNKRGVST